MSPRARGLRFAVAASLVVSALGACGGTAPSGSTRPSMLVSTSPSVPLPTAQPPTAQPTATPTGSAPPTPAGAPFDFEAAEVVADRLDVPWAIAFLPNGAALVTERESGRIVRIEPGQPPEEVARIEDIARDDGEGGLLGLAVSPTYDDDASIFVFYSTGSGSRIARVRLGQPPVVILDDIPGSPFHTGGRVAFGPDGKLYASVGDGLIEGASQDPGSLAGKILRIEPDGSVPADNPTTGSPVWSFGHRNVEGFTWDDGGRMWATEFGEDAFDELNLIEPGSNYGWPEVEGLGGEPRFRDPLVVWPPAEASPAGIAYASGSLWIGALRGTRLWSVPIHDWVPGSPESVLEGNFGRLRAVEVAPDGSLWIATSNRDGRGEAGPDDDRIVRIPPRRP